MTRVRLPLPGHMYIEKKRKIEEFSDEKRLQIEEISKELEEKMLSKEEICKNAKGIEFLTGKISAIYFLLYKGEVVYVGESNNCMDRISTHLKGGELTKKGQKIFDSFYILPMDEQSKAIRKVEGEKLLFLMENRELSEIQKRKVLKELNGIRRGLKSVSEHLERKYIQKFEPKYNSVNFKNYSDNWLLSAEKNRGSEFSDFDIQLQLQHKIDCFKGKADELKEKWERQKMIKERKKNEREKEKIFKQHEETKVN